MSQVAAGRRRVVARRLPVVKNRRKAGLSRDAAADLADAKLIAKATIARHKPDVVDELDLLRAYRALSRQIARASKRARALTRALLEAVNQ